MKCIFICNEKSGRSRISKYKDYILTKLKTKYDVVDYIATNHKGHATEITNELYDKYDTLVVSGGDGTLNEVINALVDKEVQPTIGYIPTGTTNDVAHSLKIPKSIKKAVQIILNGKVFNHDVFKVNDKYGIYVCSTGLFCESSYAAKQIDKKHYGRFAYYVYGAKEIFKADPLNIKIKYDDTTVEGRYCLMLIVNSRYVGGYKVNKNANLSDGFVDVILIKEPKKKGLSLKSLLTVAKLFLFGLDFNKKNKFITYLKLKEFEVNINSKTKINMDGEKASKGSFKFKAIEKGVKIFIP